MLFVMYFFLVWKPFSFKSQVQTANVNGAQLVYFRSSTGKPLILINGFGMTMQDWDPVLLEKLSTNHQLILYDDRGVGNSSGDISQLTERQQVDDLVGLMNALNIQKADILGWSMGSFIAQILAEQYPGRVRHLILVSTAPDTSHMVNEQSKNTSDPDLNGSWETSYVPLMFADRNNEQTYLQRLHTAIQSGQAPADSPEQAGVRAKQEQAMSDQNQEQRRYDDLPNIQSPTLIVAGQNDAILDPQNAALVANRIPHSQLLVLPNAGHAVLFENVDEFVSVVERFLK